MQSIYLQQILGARKISYAVFDQNLGLTDYNFKHTDYFRSARGARSETGLWELFPELVGCEDVIGELLSGKKKTFLLENVNKPDESGKIRYFNLSFSCPRFKSLPGTYLFCLIYDVTEATALEQQLRQKKYEVELVKSGFLNKDQFLSDSLLGQSDKLRETRNFINKVSQHSTTVLLQGDSGTGKSLVARLIHNASENPKAPFVEINCAAIPATLLESELFGYDKGAFTNALMSKKGLIEAADGGTLFLDEIGEMPPSLRKTRGNQSKSAQLLGLSLDTFCYRLKKFSISPKDF